MKLNEMEKKLLFQVKGDDQEKVLYELYMTMCYSNNSERREAAESLIPKLNVLSDAECMDLVKDIQKNYRLPHSPRTIGEWTAEIRQQSGVEKLKGHDIMSLQRFDPEVKHMIVFDVLSYDSPVGDKGDKMRLFLTDVGYKRFLDSQERGEVKLKKYAKVSGGNLYYDRIQEIARNDSESEQKQESVPDCYYFPATDEQINALTNASVSFEKQTKSDGSVIIRVGIDDKEKAETIMNTKKVVL